MIHTRSPRLDLRTALCLLILWSLLCASACAPEKEPAPAAALSNTNWTRPEPTLRNEAPAPAETSLSSIKLPEPEPVAKTEPALEPEKVSSPVVKEPGQELQRDILLRSARNSLKLNNKPEALTQYAKILQMYPTDREAMSEYAGLLLSEERTKEAREYYTKLVQLAPSDMDARRKLASCWIVSGYYPEAASELEVVLRRSPKDHEIAALLARVRAWARDYEGAGDIYRQYLQTLDVSETANRRLVAPVLLDLQRPMEALPLIDTLAQEFPGEVEWSLLLVRCHAQIGDAAQANRIAQSLAEVEPENIEKRLDLARQLVMTGHFKSAMTIYQQVLNVEPDNRQARLGTAEIALEGYQPSAALRVLNALRDSMEEDRNYQKVLARYHGLVGEYGVAAAQWDHILRQKPDDHDSRIAYGELLRQSGELERARTQFAKVPDGVPATERARLGTVRVLYDQGLHDEAVSLCQSLAKADSVTAEILIAMGRSLEKIGNAEHAERLCRNWLSKYSTDTMAAIQVRIALGRALHQRNRPLEAIREFHEAMKHPSGRTPECAYWMARAYDKVGRADRAKIAMISAPMKQLGDDIRSWIELGEIGLGEGDWQNATAAFEHVLRYDPDNLAAMVRLGEAQNIAFAHGTRVDPRRTLTRAIAISENNSRARLALARNYVLSKDYESARSQYKLLMANDPSSVTAKREYARAMYWDHRYDEAFDAYDQVVDTKLAEVAPIDPFGDTAEATTSGAGLDYETSLTVATNVQNEKRAKELKDYRSRQAEDAYRELISAEPANFEARFDLAQLYHSTGKTAKAIEQYEEIVRLSPLHREAPLALAQAKVLLNPRVSGGLYSSTARGREGLYDMDTTDYMVNYQHPIGDAEEFVGVGYGWRRYAPEGDSALLGSIFHVDARKKIGDNTAIYANLELPSWDEDDRFSNRLLYKAGLTHENYSGFRMGAMIFEENVADNFRTLQEDIHRRGFRVEASHKANRHLDYGASAMLADYSDENTRYEFNAFGSYLLSFAPKQLQLLAKADFTSFDEDNDGIVPDPNLGNLNHPYFAPSGYVLFSAIAEWKHWLNEDYFIGANEFWYSIGLRAAIDDESKTFQEFWLGAHYDFTNWAGIDLRTQALSSSVLDTSSVSAFLTLRWP